jgi:hypothetical protein
MSCAWFYELSGTLVASAIELPAAARSPEPSGRASAILFRVVYAPGLTDPRPSDPQTPGPAGDAPFAAGAWAHRDHGVSVGKGGDGFVLHIPGCADFWIARDGDTVTGAPLDACPAETLAQLFLDQVLPLVLHARGQFAFHASSVAFMGGALVGFLGKSGAGKSTLASSLARVATDVLFSDDCLAVEAGEAGVVAHPSYASARLWPESASALFPGGAALPLASPRTGKLRAALPAASEPMVLRRLYLLDEAEGAPSITRLSRRDALVALTAHLYRLDPGDRVRLAGELDLLEKVVSLVPVARLAYRRSYAELLAVREAVVADLRLEAQGR